MANPWERAQEKGILRNEERQLEGLTFEERADKYRESAERVAKAEKLATLVRGFVSGCGGVSSVTEGACARFVKDHGQIVEDVGSTKDPAYVLALVKQLSDK